MLGAGFWYYEANAGGPASAGPAVPVGTRTGIQVGMLAPEFTLPDLGQGQEVSLRYLLAAGRPVYLNFWASWCTACRFEISDIERLQREYGKRVTIVGVDEFGTEANLSAVRAFVRQQGINYPVLLDETNQVGNDYLLQGLPLSVFLNSRGVIEQYHPGVFLNYTDLLAATQPVLQQ